MDSLYLIGTAGDYLLHALLVLSIISDTHCNQLIKIDSVAQGDFLIQVLE
jgi:hypothetical protein